MARRAARWSHQHMDATPGDDEHDDGTAGTPVGRRVLLGTLGLGAAGLAAAPWRQRGMEGFLGAAADKDPTGLTGLLPNGGGFRYYSVTSSVPHKDADELPPHRRRPRRPARRVHASPTCGPCRRPGWSRTSSASPAGGCPDTPFEGVRLSALLDAAGVRPAARAVRFTCFDGAYTESLTLDQARRAGRPGRPADAGQGRSATPTAARSASTSRPCTSTSRRSGSPASPSPTRCEPGYWEERGLRRRRLGRPVERTRRCPHGLRPPPAPAPPRAASAASPPPSAGSTAPRPP